MAQVPSGSCGLTNPAFCDTFDAAAGNPATRTGDLNPLVWGVSRTTTNPGQQEWNLWSAATLNGASVRPPNDVRIIGGRLTEAVNDDGGQTTLAMYPKQPFDINGRTGKIAFDLADDSEGIHAAWPEIWFTDQPVPAPHGELSAQFPYARNSFGFSIAGQCEGNVTYGQGGSGPYVTVDRMQVTRAATA